MEALYKQFTRMFCVYQGTSDDLLFWVLIDTLFLTLNKGLTAEQISLLMTVALMATLTMRIPVYKIMRRVGNAASMVIAAVLFMLSACIFTFGNSFAILGVGQVLYSVAPLFQDASQIFLKDNLDSFGKSQDYVKTFSAANTIYATITLIAACFTGKLFNISAYLPMYLCIGFCVNSLVLSILLAKHSTIVNSKPVLLPGRETVSFTRPVIKCIILYSLNYIIFYIGNTNLKLLFQNKLENIYSQNKVVYAFGGLIILTRVAKLVSNAILNRIETTDSTNRRVLITISTSVMMSLLLTLAGCVMPSIVSAALAGFGLLVITMAPDPMRTILNNYALNTATGKNSQLVLSGISFIRDLTSTIASMTVTLILSFSGLYAVVLLLLLVSVLLLVLSIAWKKKLHRDGTPFSYFDLDQYIDKIESINLAAAFLVRHYNLLRKEKGEALIAKSSNLLKIRLQEPYSKNTLKQEYRNGHPCAVEIVMHTKSMWFPVIFLDDDDAIIADFNGQRHAFLSEYDDVVNFCSFEIVKENGKFKNSITKLLK